MTWVRTTLGISGSKDAPSDGGASSGSLSMRYIVKGFEPAQILSNPTAVLGGDTGTEPLPALGSAHPQIPGFKLDRYDCNGTGVICEVTAIYSPNGSGRLPQNPTGTLPPNRFKYSRETLKWPLPFATREPQEMDVDGTTSIIMAWIIKSEEIEQDVQVRGYTIRVTANEIDAAFEAATVQNKKLHRLGGKLWRFSCSMEAVLVPDLDLYEIEYKWTHDPGWLLPNSVNFTNTSFPTIQTIGGQDYTRPPFHIFEKIGRQADLTANPNGLFVTALYAEIDENGWQSLYGLS